MQDHWADAKLLKKPSYLLASALVMTMNKEDTVLFRRSFTVRGPYDAAPAKFSANSFDQSESNPVVADDAGVLRGFPEVSIRLVVRSVQVLQEPQSAKAKASGNIALDPSVVRIDWRKPGIS